MKNIKKTGIICVITMLLAAVLSACFKNTYTKDTDSSQIMPEEEVKFNDDGTLTLGKGYTAHGLYTNEDKLVEPNSAVVCEDGCIRGLIHFQQNLTGTMEYGLIIMTDFIQKKFAVKGEQYDIYRFSLTEEEEVKFEIELPVDYLAYEMEYLIVPEPDAKNFSMDSQSGWNNFLATQAVYSSSYRIIDQNGNERVPHVFDQIDTKELGELDHKGGTGLELLKSSKDLSVFDSAKAGSQVCLCLGGMSKEADAYVLVAFCNWKQTEVAKGEPVRCYTSVPNRNSYDEIILPNINEDVVYQMFAFELPIKSRQIGMVNSTFRIKLERK